MRDPRSLVLPWTLTLLGVLSAGVPAAAQEEGARLQGTVVEAPSAVPVPGARILLPGLERSTAADSTGTFELTGLPAGVHELRVEATGYAPAAVSVRLDTGTVRSVTLSLVPRPLELPGIAVDVEAETFVPGFLHRRENRDGHFLTKAEIADADPVRLSALLDDLENVRARYRPPNRAERGGWTVGVFNHLRSYRAESMHGGQDLYCTPSLLLDGRLLPPDRTAWRLDDIKPEEVLAVEVYWKPSQVPGRFSIGPVSSAEPIGAEAPTARSRTASGSDPARTRSGEGGVLQPGSAYDPREPAIGPQAVSCGAIVVWTELRPEG